mgnify:CR=1 FL=1
MTSPTPAPFAALVNSLRAGLSVRESFSSADNYQNRENYGFTGRADYDMDAVTFTVATNPGAPSGALNRIASGGELSRFLLALKVCLTGDTPGLTMIFDEIDRGEEPYSFVMSGDSGHGQGTGQVCFSGSRPTDEHDILRSLRKLKAG